MGMPDIKFEEIEFFSTSSRQGNQEAIKEMQADLRQRKTPAVQLVSEMIQMALAKHASDIHIEPRAHQVSVRIRVDGVLRDLQSIPPRPAEFARFAGKDSVGHGYRGAPQSPGRPVHGATGRPAGGPASFDAAHAVRRKVVMRLLESTAQVTSLRELGMSPDVEELLSNLLVIPQGMILGHRPDRVGKRARRCTRR